MKSPGCNWLAINSLWCEVWWTKDKLKGTAGKTGLLDPVSFAGWVSSPKEGRNSGFCPCLHHCGAMRPSSFCALVQMGVEKNLFFSLSKREDLPHVFRLYCHWFTRSVKDCGEAFQHGKDVPNLIVNFDAYERILETWKCCLCRDCWRFSSPASPFKQHSHQP